MWPERWVVAAGAASSMNSSAPGLGKLVVGSKLVVDMDSLRLSDMGQLSAGVGSSALLDVAGVAGRHVEHDTTGKTDFNPLNAKGTELSHLADFCDWLFEGRSSSLKWIVARLLFGENRQTVRLARLAANATSPFAAIYVKVASNVDRDSSRRDEAGFERRLAPSFGAFQGQMSNRVAEGGLKTPKKSAKKVAGVERMSLGTIAYVLPPGTNCLLHLPLPVYLEFSTQPKLSDR